MYGKSLRVFRHVFKQIMASNDRLGGRSANLPFEFGEFVSWLPWIQKRISIFIHSIVRSPD
jgi:hypothetical protein